MLHPIRKNDLMKVVRNFYYLASQLLRIGDATSVFDVIYVKDLNARDVHNLAGNLASIASVLHWLSILIAVDYYV